MLVLTIIFKLGLKIVVVSTPPSQFPALSCAVACPIIIIIVGVAGLLVMEYLLFLDDLVLKSARLEPSLATLGHASGLRS